MSRKNSGSNRRTLWNGSRNRPSPGTYIWDSDARKIQHTWFADGELNLGANCLDRHVKTKLRDKIAIIWQGDAEDEVIKITYAELHTEVCKFANALKSLGIKKGDRVAIYLPMMVEAAVAMLCVRAHPARSIRSCSAGSARISLSGSHH